MNPYSDGELDTFGLLQTDIEVFHRREDTKTRADSPLCIVLMGLGIAEVDKEPVPQELGDMPIIASNHLGTDGLVGTDHVSILFGVELRGEFRGIDQVAEHDGELPSFRVRRSRANW